MPKFRNEEDRGIWDNGREYERQRIMDSIELELMQYPADSPERIAYRKGLKAAQHIMLKLAYKEAQ